MGKYEGQGEGGERTLKRRRNDIGRLWDGIQYDAFRELQVGQCVKEPEGDRKRPVWLVVGTKATDVSRVRSQGSCLLNKEESKADVGDTSS